MCSIPYSERYKSHLLHVGPKDGVQAVKLVFQPASVYCHLNRPDGIRCGKKKDGWLLEP